MWAAPKVEDIVDRAHHAAYYAGKDGRARVKMTITDSGGSVMERQFTMLRSDVSEGGDRKYLVVFERPAAMRNTVFLVHKRKGGDDDRWLFMPALDLVKRVSAGDKRTSFVGSHFLYEDVSGRFPSEDTHTFIKSTNNSYLIKGVPKKPAQAEFAYYEAHIDQATYLPRKIEYFDQKGTCLRTMEATAMQVIDGHPTVTKIEVDDRLRGGKTVIEFQAVQHDIGIPDGIFVERSLRSPPTTWLRGK